MRKDGAKKLAIGASLAAVAGYLTGLLTAPKSGREMREDIKHTTESGLHEGEEQLKRAVAEIGDLLEGAKAQGEKVGSSATKELDDLKTKAKTAREKAQHILSAIHEGNADDRDLKAAVQEAQQAVKHLRVYLKKQP